MTDEIKVPDVDVVAMLMDTSLCASMYLMGKVCSITEIDTFYGAMDDRLIEQGFDQIKVDEFIKAQKENIFQMREHLNSKEADNGDKV